MRRRFAGVGSGWRISDAASDSWGRIVYLLIAGSGLLGQLSVFLGSQRFWSFINAAASSRTSGFMKNVPPRGVMFTCTPSASSSDATIGPTAATTMDLNPWRGGRKRAMGEWRGRDAYGTARRPEELEHRTLIAPRAAGGVRAVTCCPICPPAGSYL